MGLTEDRQTMIAVLKEGVVTRLRELGFKGSSPHFHRPREVQTDLLTFQFDKYGGGFVVEISKAPPGDFTTSWGEVIPAKLLRADYLPPHERLRLGSLGPEGDHWFRYDEPESSIPLIAEHVRRLLEEQAEPWWHAA